MSFPSRIMLLAILLASAAAGQAQVVFTFDGTVFGTVPTFQVTAGGITLSASNPNSNSGNFAADGDGLFITSDTALGQSSFQFSFDAAVQITAYEVSFPATAGTFSLSGALGGSSAGNSMTTTGDSSLNGTFSVAAGELITFTSTVGSSDFAQLQSFTVVSAVPEPAETTAIAAGVCGVVAFAARRRFGRGVAV